MCIIAGIDFLYFFRKGTGIEPGEAALRAAKDRPDARSTEKLVPHIFVENQPFLSAKEAIFSAPDTDALVTCYLLV